MLNNGIIYWSLGTPNSVGCGKKVGGGGGGGIRFCIVDFRSFNQNTLKDAQPLSRIDETLDALDGASDFSTFSFSQWLLAG